MEFLYRIKVLGTRLSVILCDSVYPSVSATPYSQNHPEPLHEHPVFEVFFIKSGFVEFHTPESVQLHGAGIVLIPPHVRHRTVPQGCDARSVSFIPEPKYEHERNAGIQLTHSIGDTVSALPMQEDQRFYINQLARQNTEENVSHLLSLLFSSILSPFVPTKSNSQATLNHRTKYTGTVESFLQKNAYKKIHLRDLAEILSLSEKQCARLLKKHYGCTLSDLIHKSRMENAAVMLKYTDLPINEIAHRLGYEYENYFYTVFRKHYSITPFEYRARALREMEEAESESGADNT